MIATTISQSKKLLELGLSPETADMYWDVNDTGSRSYTLHVGKNVAIERNLFSFREGMVVPCWSFSALMKLVPNEVVKENIHGACILYKTFSGKYRMAADRIMSTDIFDNPLDAAYNMVVYLIENGYIKTEKK